jgi:hypothetical protein
LEELSTLISSSNQEDWAEEKPEVEEKSDDWWSEEN